VRRVKPTRADLPEQGFLGAFVLADVAARKALECQAKARELLGDVVELLDARDQRELLGDVVELLDARDQWQASCERMLTLMRTHLERRRLDEIQERRSAALEGVE
jgi:hypothetical protein